jgi:hypothetical protein
MDFQNVVNTISVLPLNIGVEINYALPRTPKDVAMLRLFSLSMSNYLKYLKFVEPV